MVGETTILETEKFMVGMAEMAVSHDRHLVLGSYPLGACLGVAIYDPVAKVGGLLHSLLPASSIDPSRAATRPAMFLDTGLAAMIARAEELHATRENILVYVAGGAQIMDETTSFNIGRRNYDVLCGLLSEMKLKIYAEDIGGRANRTMQLEIASGEVRLKFSGQITMKTLCKPSTTT